MEHENDMDDLSNEWHPPSAPDRTSTPNNNNATNGRTHTVIAEIHQEPNISQDPILTQPRSVLELLTPPSQHNVPDDEINSQNNTTELRRERRNTAVQGNTQATQNNANMINSRPQRQRRRPIRFEDYILGTPFRR